MTKNIDGLFFLSIVNSSDPSKYLSVALFAGSFGTVRNLYLEGTLGQATVAPFADMTWYRIILKPDPHAGLVISLKTDDGKIIGAVSTGLGIDQIGPAYRIGFGQWMGGPDRTHNLDGVVDYIRVNQ